MKLEIRFAEHVTLDQVQSMVTSGASCGDVYPGDSERCFIVDIRRSARFPSLKAQLENWERYGFVRWSVVK